MRTILILAASHVHKTSASLKVDAEGWEMTNERYETSKIVMVRYGELFLKSEPVKRHFIRILTDNIHRALRAEGIDHHIETPRGRILIHGSEMNRMVSSVARVFGVIDAGICDQTTNNPELLIPAAATRAKNALSHGQSFAVRVKRQLKTGPSSQELAALIGAEIQKVIPGVSVNLTHPDYELIVEIRESGGFICDYRIAGPGGLPLTTQGTVLCLLSSGIDSPVAAWLMMKRGCSLEALFVDGGRWSGSDVFSTAVENLRRLSTWCPGHPIRMQVISSERLFDAMKEQSELPKVCCVICKRFMIRAASALAERTGALALVTGENLGQVASQTLPNLATISSAATIPIIRPLITYDKQEIINLAKTIGTYSGQQGDLACRAVPLRPATNAALSDIQALEMHLNIPALVAGSLKESRSVIAMNGRIEDNGKSVRL